MIVIGLTGSIATGKSTVGRIFKQLKIPVFDSDLEVHNMLSNDIKIINSIVNIFGNVTDKFGKIDRDKLGKMIFFDSLKRKSLEKIIHPKIKLKQKKFIKFHRRNRHKKVVLDIPLIFETKTQKEFDKIIVVWSPRRIQYIRALKRKNMTESKLKAIISNQMPQHQKKLHADLSIPSSLGIYETRKRILRWLIREF